MNDAIGTAPKMTSGPPVLTREQAAQLAERYLAAYNNRDLEAMLAVQDENVVSYPTRLGGAKPHRGHDGVRAWWREMAAGDRWYQVLIEEIRHLAPNRVAVLGEIYDQGEQISPWCVVIGIRNGLIVESHSYLSESKLLEQLGVIPSSDA
ncbi:MAG TPA: nuclear transport factor 2 family protein [Solirubrobacteraceae bacterium]|nr:nuclear transport factor 2 family protein [Solirubrobacteraceae bacterium]